MRKITEVLKEADRVLGEKALDDLILIPRGVRLAMNYFAAGYAFVGMVLIPLMYTFKFGKLFGYNLGFMLAGLALSGVLVGFNIKEINRVKQGRPKRKLSRAKVLLTTGFIIVGLVFVALAHAETLEFGSQKELEDHVAGLPRRGEMKYSVQGQAVSKDAYMNQLKVQQDAEIAKFQNIKRQSSCGVDEQGRTQYTMPDGSKHTFLGEDNKGLKAETYIRQQQKAHKIITEETGNPRETLSYEILYGGQQVIQQERAAHVQCLSEHKEAVARIKKYREKKKKDYEQMEHRYGVKFNSLGMAEKVAPEQVEVKQEEPQVVYENKTYRSLEDGRE